MVKLITFRLRSGTLENFKIKSISNDWIMEPNRNNRPDFATECDWNLASHSFASTKLPSDSNSRVYRILSFTSQSNLNDFPIFATIKSENMHLAYDAKRLFHNRAGLGNYSRNLLSALIDQFPENHYSLFNPKKAQIQFPQVQKDNVEIITPGKLYKKLHPLWRTRGIVKDIRKIQPDIYHGLSNELPYGTKSAGIKTIVTIHDLIFVRHPEWYKPIDVMLYTKKYSHACRDADRIIAIGEQTKSDLMEFWKIEESKIDIVKQGCNPLFSIPASPDKKEMIRKKYNLPETFLIQVGTIEPRKNHLTSIKALKQLKSPIPLVIIGRDNHYKAKLTDYIQQNKLTDKVLFLHHVTNEDLPVLYQLAFASVYPSHFEGFGIPVLESIESGTPAITTAKQCFKDAGGDAAIYINPTDASEMAYQIEKLIDDSDYYETVNQKNKLHVTQFTSDVIAQNMMNVYRKVKNS